MFNIKNIPLMNDVVGLAQMPVANRTGGALVAGRVYALDFAQGDAASTTIGKGICNLVAVAAGNLKTPKVIAQDTSADDVETVATLAGLVDVYVNSATTKGVTFLIAVAGQTYLTAAAPTDGIQYIEGIAMATQGSAGTVNVLKFAFPIPMNLADVNASMQATKITVAPVAAAGSTVADAGQLGSSNIVFITSDGATKGVKLPAVTEAGVVVQVVNNSSTAAELYAESSGTVNGLAADASVVVPASKGLLCISTAAKTWIAFDMAAAATAS